MDGAKWSQEMMLMKPPPPSSSMANMVVSSSTRPPQLVERRTRNLQKEQPLNCPRCNSPNTKFCYYNNYSLSQPRYFCKSCRRYWTDGGSLRNVPVGGGSRKNKRSSSSSSSSSSSTITASSSSLPTSISNPISKKPADSSDLMVMTTTTSTNTPLPMPTATSTPNPKFNEGDHRDLNLSFTPHHHHHHHHHQQQHPNLAGEYVNQFRNISMNNNSINNTSATCSSTSSPATASATAGIGSVSANSLSSMDLLRRGRVPSGGFTNPFISMPIVHVDSSAEAVYPSGGFGLQDFRSSTTTLNFPINGIDGEGGYDQNNAREVGVGTPGGAGSLLFPFEDLSQQQVSSSNPITDHHQQQQQFEQNRRQEEGDSSGFWNW